ncbi:MAG: glycoside hydrolase family 3 C-terminal domain-containing protein [Clostridia bacterium]|nr:glycoside hydrolase family 3 C-terminal domain-containing protein [Clostridia bacterium]MBQ9946554.1 glycoside hydrolase family 3 C-terminal domain-containing protein [Clostridia bacterium]
MTLEQKAAFVSGLDYWHTQGSADLGLPSINITDGPHGLRKKNENKKASDGIGLGNSVPATCFPPASATACSWDPELIRLAGEALGEECLKEKVSVVLGPGMNIKRAPTCGRNFEYFSEDPLLAGKMAAGLVKGVQSKGIGTSLKHYACNSQEAYRMIVDEVVDERALREIYLAAFEIAVKEASPWTVMNSYNRINGEYASQNEYLQKKVLRDEWGFDGLIVTDWGSSVDRIPGLNFGTDLEMPSSGGYNTKKIIDAVNNGELSEDVLNERADTVIDLIIKSKPALDKGCDFSFDDHHAVARKVAEGSMVLLKNDDGILPLKQGAKVAVIGELAAAPRFQGAGSSVINPTRLDNALEELKKLGVDVTYAKGYEKSKNEINDALFTEAKNAAKNADIALVFVGLTEEFEGEGYDRMNIEMPSSHNELVSEIAKVNPNTAVVLAGGSVINLPWINEVKALLDSRLGGQATGSAVANILTGKVNPSGKTSETYPLSYEENPTFGNYPGGPVTSEHRESIYIGYRYYDKAKKEVLFPFGYGLSYTKFEYSDISVSAENITDADELTVKFKVKNIGDVDGAEVTQLYVGDIESTIYRAVKDLRAFEKVFLKAGEEKEVTFTLSKRDFAFFNVYSGEYQVESGEFAVLVGASSRDIKLMKMVNVTSSDTTVIPDYRASAPAYYTADKDGMTGAQFEAVLGRALPSAKRDTSKPIDIYCCLDDARHTKWGGRICRLIEGLMAKMGSDANGDGKMIAAMATQIPIRNFIAMSMGVFSVGMADGLLMILNDDKSSFIGLMKILGRIIPAITKLPALLKSI